MSSQAVAKRYALALFQLAKESDLLETAEAELRAIKQVFTENSDLIALLQNPKFSIEKKKELLEVPFAGLSPYVKNTLFLLVERHRDDIIPEVAEGFIELANEERGVAEATVYSVRPLTDEEKQSISNVFAQKVGKQTLKLTNIVDNGLIGGLKLRIGNRIYDGSVSGKLERLARQLTI